MKSRKIREQVPDLEYSRIEFSEEQIDHARGVIAARAKEAFGRTEAEDARNLIEHLGLLPGAEWYERRENGGA